MTKVKGLPTAHGFIRRTVYAGFLPFMHCCELRWSPSKCFLLVLGAQHASCIFTLVAMLCQHAMTTSPMARLCRSEFPSAHVFVPAHEWRGWRKLVNVEEVLLLQRLKRCSPRCIVEIAFIIIDKESSAQVSPNCCNIEIIVFAMRRCFMCYRTVGGTKCPTLLWY